MPGEELGVAIPLIRSMEYRDVQKEVILTRTLLGKATGLLSLVLAGEPVDEAEAEELRQEVRCYSQMKGLPEEINSFRTQMSQYLLKP